MNRDHVHTWTPPGADAPALATISPCSWMGPGAGYLQIKITAYDGNAYARISKPWDECTPEDVAALCAPVRFCPCSRCGHPAFDPSTAETNRAGLCEACFMADINKEFASIAADEQKRLDKRDRAMKRKGMTHRTTAWVHPPRGDDYALEIYSNGELTKTEIEATLKRKKSRLLTDWTQIKLP